MTQGPVGDVIDLIRISLFMRLSWNELGFSYFELVMFLQTRHGDSLFKYPIPEKEMIQIPPFDFGILQIHELVHMLLLGRF